MAEEETIFSSNIKYGGIFPFSDFYNFCYSWLTEETGLDISEDKYEEKLSGDSKNIEIKWTGEKKVTDYFKFEFKITFKIGALKKVEINKEGKKIETNKGSIKISVKGNLIRDYEGKFKTTAFKEFLRSIYEKWVISSRIEQFQEKISEEGNEFVSQAKAYLDLEGKR
ncbi:hypothetical protein CMI40_00605 [Candidatus Pacearchaeota archaeon]|jgi:hypothetical protein|nr:hypothetical protein [Candidatus Pacearchaeota archaeon]|tara:strand:- start:1475 stop:1978 length:504 start_codon:yes stop_codon:yes gene_type:complete